MTFKFLETFHKEASKIEGVSDRSAEPRYWVGSGNFTLNKIMSGNFSDCAPQGRILGLVGPSSSGKSFITANIARAAQRDGAFLLVLDSENALDDNFMSGAGIDVNTNYIYKKVITIENVESLVYNFLKGYKEEYASDIDNAPKVHIAIDSLDMLMTDSEYEHFKKGTSSADQGLQRKMQKKMLKKFVHMIEALNVTMTVTSQVYRAKADQLLEGEGKWVVNDAIRYALSQIILVTRLKLKDDQTKDVVGVRMKCAGFKTRFALPFQECTMHVKWGIGIEEHDGMFEAAVSLGVIKKHGAWYSLADSTTKWRAADFAEYQDEVLIRCAAISDRAITLTEPTEDEDVPSATTSKRAQKVMNATAMLNELEE
jgi:RecA/RadA recombinase